MKQKTVFICSNCEYQTSKWMGQCSDCSSWNTLHEQIIQQTKNRQHSSIIRSKATLINLATVDPAHTKINSHRVSSGIPSFDRLLGGGYVSDSLILLGGKPGIGKSTLLLSLANTFHEKTIYISGEESSSQVLQRAKRLGIKSSNIFFLHETNIENIESIILQEKPKLVLVDSIQTIQNEENNSFVGSPSQIKESTQRFLELVKHENFTCILTCHITKDGQIAGPKLLEHAVDVVLYFEESPKEDFRFIRAFKNRFGCTGEIAAFEMTNKGLIPIKPNQVALHLEETGGIGSILFPQIEGSQTILLEIQALVTPTGFTNGRRIGQNVEVSRIHLMSAILEKHLGYKLSQSDIYVQTRGSVPAHEPAVDLAICIAIASSYLEKEIPTYLCAAGEVSLKGTLRSPNRIEQRLKEIAYMHIPKILIGGTPSKQLEHSKKVERKYFTNLSKCITSL